MDVLPTYQQATTRPDWLQLAAPYIAFADYPSLCRVSRRFWSVFAPRLWRDPCAASKRLGWGTDGDTTRWWARFMSQKLRQLTPKTRLLIRVLDARGATGPRDFAMYPELTRSAFKLALELLPNVEALVLDDHIGLDVRFLGLNPQQPSPLGRALRMLSLNNVTNGVLTVLTSHNNLPQLVYLDISGTPLPNPNEAVELLLPKLRILKLHRNGIYADRLYYINIFDRRLWSLDLSDNKLTDRSVQFLLRQLDPRRLLRTSQHKKTEGIIEFWMDFGSHIPFICLREVHGSSDVFLPGDRYLVDAPAFSTLSNSEEDTVNTRSDGSLSIRPDTLDGVLQLLSRDGGITATDHLPGSVGLTHLHLSGNNFSAAGIESLLRRSNGQIEHFDCDSMRLYLPDGHNCQMTHGDLEVSCSCRLHTSKLIGIYGFSGLSQIFRPVWCSNLRSLRIHHSLVTNIPTLKIPDYRAIECLYLAEKHILPGLDWAYSIAFLPDMNPRLQTLTLTCVPRHSFGPLVHKLTFFLRLLGLQEQVLSIMNKAEESRPGRSVRLVSGLRHLALEMEPREEMGSPLELDAEELMTSGETPFSFFDDPEEKLPPKGLRPRAVEIWNPMRPKSSLPPPNETVIREAEEIEYDIAEGYMPAVLPRYVQRDLSREKWIRYRETGRSPLVAVWAGNTWSPSPVVQMYRRLVLEHGVHEDLGPVSIHHTRAGAPAECLIFHKTWFIAALPQSLEVPPTIPSPEYEDVAAELRRRHVSTYEDFERIRQQSPHRPCFYWGGTFKIIDTGPKNT